VTPLSKCIAKTIVRVIWLFVVLGSTIIQHRFHLPYIIVFLYQSPVFFFIIGEIGNFAHAMNLSWNLIQRSLYSPCTPCCSLPVVDILCNPYKLVAISIRLGSDSLPLFTSRRDSMRLTICFLATRICVGTAKVNYYIIVFLISGLEEESRHDFFL